MCFQPSHCWLFGTCDTCIKICLKEHEKKKNTSPDVRMKKGLEDIFLQFLVIVEQSCASHLNHKQCDCHSIKPLICTTNLNTALIDVAFPSRNIYIYANHIVMHHTYCMQKHD